MNDQGVQTGILHSVSTRSESWDVFGRKLPKSEIVFFAQIVVIYTVLIASIVKRSTGNESDLWVLLIGTSLGAVLPHPDMPVLKPGGDQRTTPVII